MMYIYIGIYTIYIFIFIDILLGLYSVGRFWCHEGFGLGVKPFSDII